MLDVQRAGAQAQIDRPARSCRQIFTTFLDSDLQYLHFNLNNDINNIDTCCLLHRDTALWTKCYTYRPKSLRNAAHRTAVDPLSTTAWYPRQDPRRMHDSEEPPTIAVSHPNVFWTVVHRHPLGSPSTARRTLREASVAGHVGVFRPPQ